MLQFAVAARVSVCLGYLNNVVTFAIGTLHWKEDKIKYFKHLPLKHPSGITSLRSFMILLIDTKLCRAVGTPIHGLVELNPVTRL